MRLSSLLVLAIITINCSKDDTPPAITNLDFTISVGEDPLSVSVTPSANGAETFQVYFDAEGDPNNFVSTGGDAVTYTYPAASASYLIRVVASNTNGAEDVEATRSHTVSYAPPRLMAGFETTGEFFVRVGDGMSFNVTANPNNSGNDSANSAQVVAAGQPYEAIVLFPSTAIDMTRPGKKIISFDFYQEDDAAVQVLAKLEGPLADSSEIVDVEVEKTVTGAGWQNLTFNFESERKNSYPYGTGHPQEQGLSSLDSYQKLVIFIGFGSETTGTYYIDNIAGGADGVAIPDTDSDSVIDTVDACPNDAGPIDTNGCPTVTIVRSDDFEGGGNITWDAANVGVSDEGMGVNLTLFANPDASGINTSATVGRYEDYGAAQYAHMIFNNGGVFDLSTNNIVRVKVYVPTPSTPHDEPRQLSLKLQDGSSPAPWETQIEIIKPYVYDVWQELVFDFSDQAGATNFTRVLFQFNGENNYEGVVAYIDDVVMNDDNAEPVGGTPTGGDSSDDSSDDSDASDDSSSDDTSSEAKTDDFEGNGNITWDSSTTGVNDAGMGVNFSTVANPDASGINTSANVGQYEDTGSAQYAHMIFNNNSNYDLSTRNVVRVKVYVPTPATAHTAPAQLALKLQDGGLSAPWETQIEVIQTYQYDTWQELVFDFSGQAAATNFNRMIVQFNGENNYEAVTAYIDDFTLGEQ